MKKYLIIAVFGAAFGLFGSAQKIEPKGTFNVELTLPGSTVNAPFSDIMQGLANSSMYYQYSFPFHFNVGGGVRYMLFTIDEFAVPNKVYGSLQTGTVFAKLGWDKFHSERFATDLGLKIGYMEGFYSTDLNSEKGQNPQRFNAPAIEGTLGLILTADERNSYRLVLGYGGFGHGFSPQILGLESNENYDVSEYPRPTQYFTVGFGYTYYFGQKSASD